jgi:hypothetical protein
VAEKRADLANARLNVPNVHSHVAVVVQTEVKSRTREETCAIPLLLVSAPRHTAQTSNSNPQSNRSPGGIARIPSLCSVHTYDSSVVVAVVVGKKKGKQKRHSHGVGKHT